MEKSSLKHITLYMLGARLSYAISVLQKQILKKKKKKGCYKNRQQLPHAKLLALQFARLYNDTSKLKYHI